MVASAFSYGCTLKKRPCIFCWRSVSNPKRDLIFIFVDFVTSPDVTSEFRLFKMCGLTTTFPSNPSCFQPRSQMMLPLGPFLSVPQKKIRWGFRIHPNTSKRIFFECGIDNWLNWRIDNIDDNIDMDRNLFWDLSPRSFANVCRKNLTSSKSFGRQARKARRCHRHGVVSISCTLILDTWNRLWSKVFPKKKSVQSAKCITVHTYHQFGVQSELHQFALFPTLSIFVFVQGERLDEARKFEVASRCRDVHKANL